MNAKTLQIRISRSRKNLVSPKVDSSAPLAIAGVPRQRVPLIAGHLCSPCAKLHQRPMTAFSGLLRKT
jgi:hypothetical protein